MNSPVADKICTGEFFYVTGNFVEFSDKVKSPPGRILSYREQDKTGFNDLVWWTVWVEKKRHGIVEKSLVEYVSCGKLSVRKDDEGCIRIIFLIYMELW